MLDCTCAGYICTTCWTMLDERERCAVEDSTSIMLACLSEDEPLGDVQRGRLGHETSTVVARSNEGTFIMAILWKARE